jgi:hypothetical protein
MLRLHQNELFGHKSKSIMVEAAGVEPALTLTTTGFAGIYRVFTEYLFFNASHTASQKRDLELGLIRNLGSN